MPPSDCGYFTTTIRPKYDPSFTYRIPVVFHVIQNTNGDGFLSEESIRDQIRVLNEDFLALPGTPGAPGTTAKIRFRLAETDPDGNATNGITYSTNNTWYQDNGAYWNALAWDTNRYLNVYTNLAGGYFGYVPDWPQGGIVGLNSDRVVVWWEAVGSLPTTGWPLNMGRTLTHEVGHYFGLEHPFYGGCASASNCYNNGDLICDTLPQGNETTGCPSTKSSCGNPHAIHNYMDYTDDPCLWEFTYEQVNRMRCTIEHWRSDLHRLPELPQTFPGGRARFW
ncbi:MAG: zinc metalloprotease [Planctomycetota bacterium]